MAYAEKHGWQLQAGQPSLPESVALVPELPHRSAGAVSWAAMTRVLSFYVSFEHSVIGMRPVEALAAVVEEAFLAPILSVTLTVSEPKLVSQ